MVSLKIALPAHFDCGRIDALILNFNNIAQNHDHPEEKSLGNRGWGVLNNYSRGEHWIQEDTQPTCLVGYLSSHI